MGVAPGLLERKQGRLRDQASPAHHRTRSLRKVLVTGADGFIGSHLVEMLVSLGASVRAFSMYNSFGTRGWLDTLAPDVLAAIEVVSGDIRDAAAVREAVRGCDTVLHLAALIGIPYSYVAPESYIDTNIKGTLNVLLAARDHAVEKVVCTSTSEVYGSAQFVPITEDHPLVGQSPYSASKIGADQLALSFHLSFGLPVAIARPFNTYGPRQSLRAVIPTIIAQVAAKKDRVELGALSPTRDLSFVTDTAAGIVAVARAEQSAGQVINLGSSFEVSVGALAKLIVEAMGSKAEVVSTEERIRPAASEVNRLFASNDKARELLGWIPQYGGLDGMRRGLAKTIDWFQKPDNLRRYQDHGYAI